MDLNTKIRTIPDFPKKGIMFKDITPLLQDHEATRYVIEQMAEQFKGQKVDVVAGIESRGFIFGGLLAQELKVPFIPIRKAGKLPHQTIKKAFQLEYGEAVLEMHVDAFEKGANVVIVDDLLATGGTMAAAIYLVEELGGKVAGCSVLIELKFLNGRKYLNKIPVQALLQFD